MRQDERSKPVKTTRNQEALGGRFDYNATVFVKDAKTGKPFMAFMAEVNEHDQILRGNGFWSPVLNGTVAYDEVIRNQPFHRGNEHVIVRDHGAGYKQAFLHGMPERI
jgi:hypothetical protein